MTMSKKDKPKCVSCDMYKTSEVFCKRCKNNGYAWFVELKKEKQSKDGVR